MPFFGVSIRNGLPLGLGSVVGLARQSAAPLPPPPVTSDPYFEYVPLLLNTTSTNGAQNNTFLDSSTNAFTVTRNGDTTQGSFNPYMPTGYWSGYFDGTGDYLSVANATALQLTNSGAWTIEMWFYASAMSAQQHPFHAYNPSSPFQGWGIALGANLQANTTLLFWDGTTWTTIGTGLTPNQWYHVAISYEGSGTTGRVFLNGTQNGSAFTVASTINNITSAIALGGQNNGSLLFTGYISNARVVKGTAVYTSNFTPSTTPLTAITNTSLLCLQDNRFKDNSTNAFAITRNGDTRISKFAPFNPPASYSTASYGGSGYFDGNGDELALANNAAFEIGNGDFSYEAWVFATRQTNTFVQGIISYGVAGATGSATCSFQLDPSGYLALAYAAGAANTIVDTTLFPINQWVHAVACRSGSTLSLFVNGTRVATATTSATVGTGGTMTIGGQWFANASTRQLQGYISNARVLKGSSAYNAASSTITVPTAPLTAITNTSLLLNFTNAGIYDAATINDGQTVGNAQVSTTQAKWSPTSMAFDGTGDYVTVIDKPELRIGTGDFTIEGWVYLTATGVAYGLVSKGTATTGWSVNVTSGNKLQFSYTATQLTGATSLASGTWYYFAVVRSGTATGNLKLYLDSVLDATSAGAVTDNFNQTNVLYVGADRVAGAVLNGYLQDVRVTNGYARTISTPTAAFPTL